MKPLLYLWCAFATTLACAGSVLGQAQDEPAKIRDFPVATLERLGQELFQKDALAAFSTDLLLEKHPEDANMLAGWITQLGPESARVYFLKRTEADIVLSYIAVFVKGKEPVLEQHMDKPVPEPVKLRVLARATALAVAPQFPDRPYNFEVLDDPDGEGFLVYALAATKDPNEVVAGGHSRITVSKDGTKVESVDRLSKSLLVLPKSGPGGTKPSALTMTHVVSPTPVETHVFLSLQHGIPFYVATGEKAVWEVGKGTIKKAELEKTE